MRRPAALAVYALIFLETLVFVALVPLAPTFARDLSLSNVETGAILAAATFATLLVAFPTGVLSDRFGARALTIASAVLLTVSCVGQGLASDFWSLMVARTAFGVAFGATWTAGVAWLADDTHGRRSKALGATVAVSGLGFTIGPGFAGLVADAFGTGAPFYVSTVAAAAVTAALFVVDRGEPAPADRT